MTEAQFYFTSLADCFMDADNESGTGVLLRDEISESILQLTLNRPETLNALNEELLRAIPEAIAEAEEYSVIIFRGAGESFTSGADIHEAQDEIEGVELFQELTRATRQFDGIVIGAFDGWVVGGGLEWTLSFDLRYASPETTFKLPESEIGVPISNASTILLPLTVGLGRAQELVYTSRELSATEAKDWGLVNEIFESNRLDEEVRKVATDITTNKSERALLLNRTGIQQTTPVESALETESLLGAVAVTNVDQID